MIKIREIPYVFDKSMSGILDEKYWIPHFNILEDRFFFFKYIFSINEILRN